MDVYFSKLLVGVDRKLMLFDIYKQKLVLRASSDTLSSPICSISVYGQKIFLTQIMSSFSVLRINHKTKCFETVGQDFLDRFTTCGCLLDGEAGVMAGGDKFGNFFVSKMSESTDLSMIEMRAELEEVKEVSFEPTAATPLYMDSLASFHLGEIVTAIQTGRIDLKKSERIYYATIDGRVGMLYPMDGEE
jgi:splicing factor 3B subunit 3